MTQMAKEIEGGSGSEYATSKSRLDKEELTHQQHTPLNLQLELLENFMVTKSSKEGESAEHSANI